MLNSKILSFIVFLIVILLQDYSKIKKKTILGEHFSSMFVGLTENKYCIDIILKMKLIFFLPFQSLFVLTWAI